LLAAVLHEVLGSRLGAEHHHLLGLGVALQVLGWLAVVVGQVNLVRSIDVCELAVSFEVTEELVVVVKS